MRETRSFKPDMSNVPSLKKWFRHWKGRTYQITGFVNDANTDGQLILYAETHLPYAPTWARPLKEFYEEVKNDQGEWVRRFEPYG